MSRRKFNKEFKVAAVEEIKGEKQLSELSAEFNVHPTMISVWKWRLLEKGADIFDIKGGRVKKNIERPPRS